MFFSSTVKSQNNLCRKTFIIINYLQRDMRITLGIGAFDWHFSEESFVSLNIRLIGKTFIFTQKLWNELNELYWANSTLILFKGGYFKEKSRKIQVFFSRNDIWALEFSELVSKDLRSHLVIFFMRGLNFSFQEILVIIITIIVDSKFPLFLSCVIN